MYYLFLSNISESNTVGLYVLSYSLELTSYLYVSSCVQLAQELNVQLPEEDIMT